MDSLTRIKMLCSFLNTKTNISHALRCIQSEAHEQSEVQNWIRENGYLKVLLKLSRSSDTITRRWAIYCLASCAHRNCDSQAHLCSLSLFTHLYTQLGHRLATTADHYVCLLLIEALCSGNPCGQELVCTSGCLHIVMDTLGQLLYQHKPPGILDCGQYRRLAVQCLKSCVSRPTHVGNQRAVTTHPVYSSQILQAIQGGHRLDSDTLYCVCEVISAVYEEGEVAADGTALHRDVVTCALCSNLQSLSRHDSLTKYHGKISSLVNCLISIGQSQVELHPSAAGAVSALYSTILIMCNHSDSTELQQNLIFLLLCLLNRPDSNDEPLLRDGGVRRLYVLTKLTDDPTIHCAVSYILLGLSHLSGKELTLVRQIAPGALVRMGLSLTKASELTNKHERVVTGTRKQLFESDEIMELMSSDEELEQISDQRGNKNCDTFSPQKWIQLTPPSKSRRSALTSSPGWTIRVKRLRAVLKQRRKLKRQGTKVTDKSSMFELVHREPLQVINL